MYRNCMIQRGYESPQQHPNHVFMLIVEQLVFHLPTMLREKHQLLVNEQSGKHELCYGINCFINNICLEN